MKRILLKIDNVIKLALPYTAFIAVILGIVNLIYLNKVRGDVEYTYGRIEDVENAVNDISMDYDNSDVINTIKRAHNSIVEKINDAEREITSDIIIYGN